MITSPPLLFAIAVSFAPCFVFDAAQSVQTSPSRRYISYDYKETAENMLKEVRLIVPEGLTTVRDILVVSNGAGGDTRGWYTGAWYSDLRTCTTLRSLAPEASPPTSSACT